MLKNRRADLRRMRVLRVRLLLLVLQMLRGAVTAGVDGAVSARAIGAAQALGPS